jgi:hypothetical protein
VTYKELKLKRPPKCDPCVEQLHADWGKPVPFLGAKIARWERREGDKVRMLCFDHYEQAKREDQGDPPV